MSIFETQVKDVAERVDSDPLSLNVGFQIVDSSDQLNDSNEVEAKPGHVVAVDTNAVGSGVTVTMPPNLNKTKVTVKVLDATNTVTVTDLNGSDITIDSQYSSLDVISDGSAYHAVSAYDASADGDFS